MNIKSIIVEEINNLNKTYIDPLDGKKYSQHDIDAYIKYINNKSADKSVKDILIKLLERLGSPKKTKNITNWSTNELPAIMRVLNQIEAPSEWKKTIIRIEKTINTAKNALNRGMSFQKALELTDKVTIHDMKYAGNPSSQDYGKEYDSINYPYWEKYMKLMYNLDKGNNDMNISDWLA